jgi:hypothetical protein
VFRVDGAGSGPAAVAPRPGAVPGSRGLPGPAPVWVLDLVRVALAGGVGGRCSVTSCAGLGEGVRSVAERTRSGSAVRRGRCPVHDSGGSVGFAGTAGCWAAAVVGLVMLCAALMAEWLVGAAAESGAA